jgi:hypothetical protein
MRAEIEVMLNTSREGVARVVDRLMPACVAEVRSQVSDSLLSLLQEKATEQATATSTTGTAPTSREDAAHTADMRTLLQGKLGCLGEEDFLLLRALGRAHHRAVEKGEQMLAQLRLIVEKEQQQRQEQELKKQEQEKKEKEKEENDDDDEQSDDEQDKVERYESTMRGEWQRVSSAQSMFGTYEAVSNDSDAATENSKVQAATEAEVTNEEEDFEDRETEAVMAEATERFFREAVPRSWPDDEDDEDEDGSSTGPAVFKKRRRGVTKRSNRRTKRKA